MAAKKKKSRKNKKKYESEITSLTTQKVIKPIQTFEDIIK